MSKLGMDAVSRTGNIEKAVIEIIDMRGRKVIVEPPVKAVIGCFPAFFKGFQYPGGHFRSDGHSK